MPESYISIIITIYKSRKTIAALLESIIKQSYSRSAFEAIFVFEERDQETETKIENILGKGQVRYLIHRFEQVQGAARSRNQGVSMAKGELIAFTDGDCILSTDWLKVINKSIKPSEKQIIGGKITTTDFVIFPLTAAPVDHTYVAANLAFPKALFAEVQFDPDFAQGFGEDMDFIMRAQTKGYSYQLKEEMLVEHPAKRITIGMQPKRIFRRQYEVYLHKIYGKTVNSAMHFFFRPVIWGRISLNSLVLIFSLVLLMLNSKAWLLALFLICLWMLSFGYKNLVISNPRNQNIPAMLRIELILSLSVYLPLFFLQRIYASFKFGHIVI